MYYPEGMILDVNDDPKGVVLREVFPEQGLIPASVKTAMSFQKLSSLPDDLFALVFENEGERFRKFAHPDPGHTILSTVYFLKAAHLLPKEAQQVTARNLIKAASCYGLPVLPEIEKIAWLGAAAKWAGGKALGWGMKNPGKVIGGAMTGMTLAGAAGQAKSNWDTAKQLGGTIAPLSTWGS